jgi:methylglutaconyl-CoA hydratase
MSEVLVKKSENGVAEIILNRPEVNNAIDENLIKLFTESLIKLECDETVKVICIRGSGKHFCAGADLNWMKRAISFTCEENIEADYCNRSRRSIWRCSRISCCM